jgi:hypothetical protein
MRMHLTSIGYIPGKPEGNRLRWSYPTQSLYKRNSFLGLPEKIIIERAPIQDVKYQTQLSTSSVIPLSWWDDHGSINLTGFPILIRCRRLHLFTRAQKLDSSSWIVRTTR